MTTRRTRGRGLAVTVLALFVSLTWTRPATAQEGPLTLSEVLRSVERTHPSLAEARALVVAAEGDALSSEGVFDPKLTLAGRGQPLGKYTKGQLEAYLTQATPWWGASFFAGWRRGFGSFALYDGDLETLSAGEVSTGFNLPLWQGGPIDDMRARLAQAEIEVLASQEREELVKLLVENAAAQSYWSWVEAGQNLRISEALLEVATRRAEGIERRIDKGDEADIVGQDNVRVLLDRRAKLVASGAKLEQAAVKLSLYLRDDQGAPVRVSATRLPELDALPPPTEAALERDIKRARLDRPDVALLARQQAAQRVEVDFRDNQVSPRIDLQGWLAKDFGGGKDELRPLDLGVGVSVEIPLIFRKERGKRDSARAKLSAIDQKLALAGDKVEAEVRVAYTAVVASAEIADLAAEKAVTAERLAAAERRRFELGETDLFKVNLRELNAAEAASEAIAARADLNRAIADYKTAAGLTPN